MGLKFSIRVFVSLSLFYFINAKESYNFNTILKRIINERFDAIIVSNEPGEATEKMKEIFNEIKNDVRKGITNYIHHHNESTLVVLGALDGLVDTLIIEAYEYIKKQITLTNGDPVPQSQIEFYDKKSEFGKPGHLRGKRESERKKRVKTRPPSTQQPLTQRPKTRPPSTQQPLTQRPKTRPPSTQQPLTQRPKTRPTKTRPPKTPSGTRRKSLRTKKRKNTKKRKSTKRRRTFKSPKSIANRKKYLDFIKGRFRKLRRGIMKILKNKTVKQFTKEIFNDALKPVIKREIDEWLNGLNVISIEDNSEIDPDTDGDDGYDDDEDKGEDKGEDDAEDDIEDDGENDREDVGADSDEDVGEGDDNVE